MKKSKLLSLILIIIFSELNLFGQKIFREGYIVKKSGESFIGLVKYSSNQDVPSKCYFKRFDIAREVVYSPGEIAAFGYKDGNRYESKVFDKKVSFYEVIITGKIVLYTKGSKYYIDKDHNGFVELKNGRNEYSSDNTKMEFKSLSEFLCYLTEKSPGTIAEKFNMKSNLIPLIVAYNKESGKSYTEYNRSLSEKQLSQKVMETGSNKNIAGVITGLCISKMNIVRNPYYSAYLPNPGNASSLVYGLSFERLLFRKTDRFSFKLELLYSKLSFYGYQEEMKLEGLSRNDAHIKFTGIKVPVMFQYSFTGNKLVPFINAGFAYEMISNKYYFHDEEIETPANNILTYSDSNMDLKSGALSGLAGFGVRTRIFNNIKLQVQGRVEYGQGIMHQDYDTLNNGERPFTQNAMQASLLIGLTF